MATLHLVPSTTTPSFWRCFLRTDSGPLGFERCPSVWAGLTARCWVYRASEGVFMSPLEDPEAQLLQLRREGPVGIAVGSPDSFLLDAFDQLRRLRAQQRRVQFYARHGRAMPEPSPHWLASLLTSAGQADDGSFLPLAQHAEIVQIWRHSDRGMGVLTGGRAARVQMDELAATHGLGLRVDASMREVPCW